MHVSPLRPGAGLKRVAYQPPQFGIIPQWRRDEFIRNIEQTPREKTVRVRQLMDTITKLSDFENIPEAEREASGKLLDEALSQLTRNLERAGEPAFRELIDLAAEPGEKRLEPAFLYRMDGQGDHFRFAESVLQKHLSKQAIHRLLQHALSIEQAQGPRNTPHVFQTYIGSLEYATVLKEPEIQRPATLARQADSLWAQNARRREGKIYYEAGFHRAYPKVEREASRGSRTQEELKAYLQQALGADFDRYIRFMRPEHALSTEGQHTQERLTLRMEAALARRQPLSELMALADSLVQAKIYALRYKTQQGWWKQLTRLNDTDAEAMKTHLQTLSKGDIAHTENRRLFEVSLHLLDARKRTLPELIALQEAHQQTQPNTIPYYNDQHAETERIIKAKLCKADLETLKATLQAAAAAPKYIFDMEHFQQLAKRRPAKERKALLECVRQLPQA